MPDPSNRERDAPASPLAPPQAEGLFHINFGDTYATTGEPWPDQPQERDDRDLLLQVVIGFAFAAILFLPVLMFLATVALARYNW